MFESLRRKKNLNTLIERNFKELPGYGVPSVDDLRFEAIEFEKSIVSYVHRKSGAAPQKPLGYIVQKMLGDYPLLPEIPEYWPEFVEEAKKLKDFRNNVIHSDFVGLPPLEELYEKFKRANEVLRPFGICSANRDRFSDIRWRGDTLLLKIDEHRYELEVDDIKNLMMELHPASRGEVHFLKGKLVVSKVLDYQYERITYFIESYDQFELSLEESMVLEDLLSSLLGQHFYSQ
ncbi:hypothetical protein [Pseudomonas sp. Irchel s3h9]|uniref:hypothetical protein n=1 Tax=Pseudomonas sp. Irchel s3h9 TaxID=2009192 RepID=UPI000BA4D5DB|nr:hypothetical protein [Pseudomonas sp. Irchel s3h9]